MKGVEQNDKHERSAVKKSNKKQSHRIRRQQEKVDPENAPKKTAYKGYSG